MSKKINKIISPIIFFNFNGKNCFSFPVKIEKIYGKNDFIDLAAH